MKFNVIVSYKPDILDPQGKTIQHSLEMLGYPQVSEVRSGKYFELEVEAESEQEARSIVEEVAGKLLANPNIETFRIECDK